jgi:dTDP-4-dehydrorhamnose reductase
MRVLITGAGGMLARAMKAAVAEHGHHPLALTRAELDVTDATAVRRVLTELQPDAVVQCAAYTDVDGAESDEATAFAVNAEGAFNVAQVCDAVGAIFVYPSTDYVFAGDASVPYRPDSLIQPINAYGRSKAAGEKAAARANRSLVVRTSWLYGAGGRNFVDTISALARERPVVRVVDDQFGRPTWTGTLAGVIVRLLQREATGVLHCSDGGGPVSWHGLALEAVRAQSLATTVEPVGSEAFPRPAPRPRYSVLDCSETEALLGEPLPDWRESLRRHLEGEAASRRSA